MCDKKGGILFDVLYANKVIDIIIGSCLWSWLFGGSWLIFRVFTPCLGSLPLVWGLGPLFGVLAPCLGSWPLVWGLGPLLARGFWFDHGVR